jgi:HPt (histidine-containing phosphotransfer) domain-containing protein
LTGFFRHNEDVNIIDNTVTLDREQLRNVTLDDAELMREILTALIDDTSRQLVLLQSAVTEQDPQKTMRLAHYSKGACANVGANAAAEVLKHIEQVAARRDFQECSASLCSLALEIDRLRSEMVTA